MLLVLRAECAERHALPHCVLCWTGLCHSTKRKPASTHCCNEPVTFSSYAFALIVYLAKLSILRTRDTWRSIVHEFQPVIFSKLRHRTPSSKFMRQSVKVFVHKIFSDDFGASTAILTCPGRPALARNWEVLASYYSVSVS